MYAQKLLYLTVGLQEQKFEVFFDFWGVWGLFFKL